MSRLRVAALGAMSVLVAVAVASPASASAADVTVTSFDGTPIVAHWFPSPGLAAGTTAPTVMLGPGWGSGGDTGVSGGASPATGTVGIADLHADGYNVLTWDPRGFGASGGTVESDSPDFEGRDTQALISWIADQPEAQLDAPGDPRLGMTGGSYGGGIQLVTAAIDKRIDAIVPAITWHSLGTSLFKAQTPKIGWSSLLYAIAKGRRLDPHIVASNEQATSTGTTSADVESWYLAHGPADRVASITAPTLLIQGTVDTLFTLDESVANYTALKQAGTPVKLLWFCGGHGACLTKPGDQDRTRRATIGWLDRYVKRDTTVVTGPGFDAIDQNGRRFTAPSYPVAAGTPLTGRGSGTLALRAASVAGPVAVPQGAAGLGPVAGPFTPERAARAVNVSVRAPRAVLLVGAPRLSVTYRGTRGAGPRPQRLFAQLVDTRSGRVLGNQITPVPLKLDGRRHTLSLPLEIIAHRLAAAGRVTLQLVATTPAYATPQLGGSVRLDRIVVRLPTARPGAATAR